MDLNDSVFMVIWFFMDFLLKINFVACIERILDL